MRKQLIITILVEANVTAVMSQSSRLWSTYHGGTGGEWGYSIASDTSGNIYMPGFTYSTSDIASGGFQNTFGGGTYDGYLVKFSSAALVSTYDHLTYAGYTVYPNPFTNHIRLSNQSGDEFFMMYNMSGQLLWSGNYLENQDFSHLQNGMYIIKVFISDTLFSAKIYKLSN